MQQLQLTFLVIQPLCSHFLGKAGAAAIAHGQTVFCPPLLSFRNHKNTRYRDMLFLLYYLIKHKICNVCTFLASVRTQPTPNVLLVTFNLLYNVIAAPCGISFRLFF
jgi:hypothetical protein